MRSSRDSIAGRRVGEGIAESWIARSGLACGGLDCSCFIANGFGSNWIGEETTPGVAKGATRLLIAMLHTARK